MRRRTRVEMVNVGLPCESRPKMGENDPARRFVNLKGSFYQSLADAFERDQVEGLTDEEIIRELSGLSYELDSQGGMKVESKEKARARGVPSPDRAEALMLALCKPPQRFEYYSIRDLPRLRQNAGAPPYHPEDYPSPRSRRWDGSIGPLDLRALRRCY